MEETILMALAMEFIFTNKGKFFKQSGIKMEELNKFVLPIDLYTRKGVW